MNFFQNRKYLIYIIIFSIIGIIALIFGGIFVYYFNQEINITTFDECAKKYPVQETFPERCVTKDNRTFVKDKSVQDIQIDGKVVCLPHRDTSGAQTLECAYGLQTSNDVYYSLGFENQNDLMSVPMNQTISVKGKYTPISDSNSKYNTVGGILVESYQVK